MRWTFATQTIDFSYLAASPNVVLIQGVDAVLGLRPADGHVLWHSPVQTNLQTYWLFPSKPTFIGSVIYFTAIQTLPPETVAGSREQGYL